MASALGAGLLVAGGVAPSQAKTVKVCVKKSTGEMRLLSKKKCKKGWKKVTWNQKGDTGPQGNQGAQGPNLVVKDGGGNVLGDLVGTLPMSLEVVMVRVNGGIYMYRFDGVVYPMGSPAYKNNTCSGTAFIPSTSATTTAFLTGSAGGPSRLVYRPTSPGMGPVAAYQFTTTTENVNQNMWELDDTGTCVAGTPHNGTLVALQQVASPPDVTGPLTIG